MTDADTQRQLDDAALAFAESFAEYAEQAIADAAIVVGCPLQVARIAAGYAALGVGSAMIGQGAQLPCEQSRTLAAELAKAANKYLRGD